MATGTESLASFAEFLKILFVEKVIADALSDNVVLYGELRRRGQRYSSNRRTEPNQRARQHATGHQPRSRVE